MLKTISAAALLTMASAAFSQSTPSVTPSQTPSVTPSQTPALTPSQTPSVAPSQSPSLNSPSVGGLSQCENMIGIEKDKCRQAERGAGMGSSGGTGSSGTMAPQNTAPAGSVR